MKRATAILMSLALLLGLAACTTGQTPTASPTPTAPQATAPESTAPAAQSSRALIAYFSKTGNTEEVANRIQELTGAALFRIETVTPYPQDYTQTTQVAREELEENARPEIAGTVENMEQYDVIYLGYPIWWHEAPMAVYTFLESYDLSGKTIVPFCTSGGSEIEETLPMLQEAVAGAQVRQGLTADGPQDVEPWLRELGLLDQ